MISIYMSNKNIIRTSTLSDLLKIIFENFIHLSKIEYDDFSSSFLTSAPLIAGLHDQFTCLSYFFTPVVNTMTNSNLGRKRFIEDDSL